MTVQKKTRKTGRWSVAGGARAARQARIATVEHLRHAPIARTWHLGKLWEAFQLHTENLGSRHAATLMLFGGLGYRPPYPTSWPAAAELIVADEARYLAEADLYILTPQMCDVVVAAAHTVTVDDLQLLDVDDLPSPTGVLVLPHPIITSTVVGDPADLRAFTWRTPAATVLPAPGSPRLTATPAVRLSTYHDTHGPVRPDSFLDFAAQARARGTPLPPLTLDAIRCLAFRCTNNDPDTLRRFAATAHRLGQARREHGQALGFDEDRVIGEYTPGSQIDDPDDSFVPRFLYAFWRLCEQRIAAVRAAEVNHSARVLADRAGVSPDVRITLLRHLDPHRDSQPTSRDWQHRWMVRMHKVRQWYPSEQRHKVIYRGPYLKGPDDKPLLGGETIHGLTR